MALRRWMVLLCACALPLSACGGEDEAEPSTTSVPAGGATTPAAQSTSPAAETRTATPKPRRENQAGRTYRIKPGDTLSGIAERFDTTVRALVRENNLQDPDVIRPGRRLRIP